MKSKLLLILSLLLVSPVVLADAAEDRIRALPEKGGSSEWDAKVKLIMLANYDLDGSGWIDKNPEVDMIPCSTWKALDDGVKSTYSFGIKTVYGFEAGYSWIGGAVGFSEKVRTHADGKLGGCEASGWGGGGAGGTRPMLSGPPHEQIMAATPGQGGKSPWDAATKQILLGAYDSNKSGWIDTTDELLGIPCETWSALDARVREGWGMGLRTIYGFEADKIWVGGELGFAESVRSGADMRAASCQGGTVTPTPAPVPRTGGTVAQQIRSRPETGGQDSWDAAVKKILLGAYDSNGNGVLDTSAEATALNCDDWKALDDGVKVSWDYGIRTIYGFAPGYSWVGYAIGFSEGQRGAADTDAHGCLGGTPPASQAPPVPTSGSVSDRIRAVPDGGSSAWDASVLTILVGAYDGNGTGTLDNAREVGAIPCDVWGALDAGVKSKYGYGVRSIYGFEPGFTWLGYVIGITEPMRAKADAALVGCGYE